MSASLELRRALITHLRSDSSVTSLLGGPKVFDHVPDSARDPYIQVRENARAWDTSTDYGKEHDVEINAWSSKEGRKEIDEIMRAVELSVRSASLSLNGHRLVSIRFALMDVVREDQGQTYFGYARYRAVTEEI